MDLLLAVGEVILQRYLWTVGLSLGVCLLLTPVEWLINRRHRHFDLWSIFGLLTLVLGFTTIGLGEILTAKRRWRRWLFRLVCGVLLLVFWHWWLPIGLGLLTTIGVGILLLFLIDPPR